MKGFFYLLYHRHFFFVSSFILHQNSCLYPLINYLALKTACQILDNLNKVFGFPNSMVLALPNNAGICRISVENNEVPVQDKNIEKKKKIVKVINDQNVINDKSEGNDVNSNNDKNERNGRNDRNHEMILNEDVEMTDDVILDEKNDKMTNVIISDEKNDQMTNHDTLNGKNDKMTNGVILDDKTEKKTNEVPLIVKNYKMTTGAILDDKNDKMTNHVTLNGKDDKMTKGIILNDKNDNETSDDDDISDDIEEDITEIFNSFETTPHKISKPVIQISESENSDDVILDDENNEMTNHVISNGKDDKMTNDVTLNGKNDINNASLGPLQWQLRLHTCQYCNICQFKTFSELNDHISSVHPFLSTIIIKPDIKTENLNPTRTSAAKMSDWSTSIIESQSQVLIFTQHKNHFRNELQQGLEIRGFWFQKKTVQLKTVLLEVYTYVLNDNFFSKLSVSSRLLFKIRVS